MNFLQHIYGNVSANTASGKLTDLLSYFATTNIVIPDIISSDTFINKIEYISEETIYRNTPIYINKNINLSKALFNTPSHNDHGSMRMSSSKNNMIEIDISKIIVDGLMSLTKDIINNLRRYFYGNTPVYIVTDIIPDNHIAVSQLTTDLSYNHPTTLYIKNNVQKKYDDVMYNRIMINGVDSINRSLIGDYKHRIDNGELRIGTELYHFPPLPIVTPGVNVLFSTIQSESMGTTIITDASIFAQDLNNIIQRKLYSNNPDDLHIICPANKIDLFTSNKYMAARGEFLYFCGVQVVISHDFIDCVYILNSQDFKIIEHTGYQHEVIEKLAHPSMLYKNYSIICVNPSNQCMMIIKDFISKDGYNE